VEKNDTLGNRDRLIRWSSVFGVNGTEMARGLSEVKLQNARIVLGLG